MLLHLRLQPKASRNSIHRESDGRLRVALTAPPVDGAANKALREYLASQLHIPKRAVELVAGQKSRDKIIAIEGLSVNEVKILLS